MLVKAALPYGPDLNSTLVHFFEHFFYSLPWYQYEQGYDYAHFTIKIPVRYLYSKLKKTRKNTQDWSNQKMDVVDMVWALAFTVLQFSINAVMIFMRKYLRDKPLGLQVLVNQEDEFFNWIQ